MTNGLLEKSKQNKKPGEKLLLDICQTPDDMTLTIWDFVATFTIISFGYIASSFILTVEYFYQICSKKYCKKVSYIISYSDVQLRCYAIT